MIIDKLSTFFVNLKTGNEILIIEMPVEDMEKESDEFQEIISTLKKVVQEGSNAHFGIADEMCVFGNLDCCSFGFFRFKFHEKKFLTDDDI